MPEQTSTPRTVRRLVPRQSATVAVYRGEQQVGYGILANVSEAGACIVTDSLVAPGTDLRLKLSFYQQPRLFETVARVDTPIEVDYLRNGGILHYVLRRMASA